MSFYANDEKKEKKMITVKTYQLLKNTYPLHYSRNYTP